MQVVSECFINIPFNRTRGKNKTIHYTDILLNRIAVVPAGLVMLDKIHLNIRCHFSSEDVPLGKRGAKAAATHEKKTCLCYSLNYSFYLSLQIIISNACHRATWRSTAPSATVCHCLFCLSSRLLVFVRLQSRQSVDVTMH